MGHDGQYGLWGSLIDVILTFELINAEYIWSNNWLVRIYELKILLGGSDWD